MRQAVLQWLQQQQLPQPQLPTGLLTICPPVLQQRQPIMLQQWQRLQLQQQRLSSSITVSTLLVEEHLCLLLGG